MLPDLKSTNLSKTESVKWQKDKPTQPADNDGNIRTNKSQQWQIRFSQKAQWNL